MLHGFTGSSASWGDRIVDGLAASGNAPVLVDLPGHGRLGGDREPGRFLLKSAMDLVERAGIWPSDLCGYSVGGRIALHYALSRPERVRRLVLESSSPGLETEAERSSRRTSDNDLAARIEEGGIEAFVDGWERLPLFESQAGSDPLALSRQREIRLANDPVGLAQSLRHSGTGVLPSLWERLPEITVPTLIVVGILDTKFVEIGARMCALVPHARLVVVPDAGHCVHFERPHAWLDAVATFLSEN